MRRSHHRVPLTEAIAEATARFQADVRRLARAVLEDGLGSLLPTFEPTRPGAGPHDEPVVVVGRRGAPVAGRRKPAVAATTGEPPVAARTAEPVVVGRRGAPVAVPRKPAAAARAEPAAAPRTEPAVAARGSKAAARAEPAAAARGSKAAARTEPAAAARGSKAAARTEPAGAVRASKPAAAARTEPAGAARASKAAAHAEAAVAARGSEAAAHTEPAAAAHTQPAGAARRRRPAAARTNAEPVAPRAHPPVAELPLAAPAARGAGRAEDPAVARVVLDPEPAVAGAVPEDQDPETAGPRSGAVTAAEPAAPRDAPSWGERARSRRETTAERRQQRQERARIRREAAGMRTRSAAVFVRAQPAPAATPDPVPGTDGTRAVARRIQRGTVKWFSDAKGYGFIKADDGADAFVHHSSISSEGFRTLSVGQAVSYEEVESPRGLLAVNVVPMVQGTQAPRQ